MSARSEIEYLANYIMDEIPGEPSKSEGAGHTAVRLLRKYRAALEAVLFELEPYPPFPPDVTGAEVAAEEALR